ncbi:MAG: Rieske 2Fe-2S domain-containing protein [Gammaproteobacteria bacterium]|nr:Rieske 2Fe-2S domain-containing protein [Gammaproteobacteria bacterium]
MQKTPTSQKKETPFDRAKVGFKNYWYPLVQANQITTRPRKIIMLGEPITITRRNGVAYAISDFCPHRGISLSLGKNYFRGTNTITCKFHGFTFDLTDGSCVAVLSDGPDSEAVGKLKARTFPLEEKKGILWIWMGAGKPVPLEDDIPHLMLRDQTVLKWRERVIYGNWRYHAQSDAGHFPTTHHDALALLSLSWHAHWKDYETEIIFDEVDGGEWLAHKHKGVAEQADYPGLGVWPPKRPWRYHLTAHGGTFPPIHGTSHQGIRMPGLLRVPHWPMDGAFHYEWYIPINEDYYRYVQVNAYFPKNIIHRAWIEFWHRVWVDPMRNGRFNQQDAAMSAGATNWEKHQGKHGPMAAYKPDAFATGFMDLCNRTARGETDS